MALPIEDQVPMEIGPTDGVTLVRIVWRALGLSLFDLSRLREGESRVLSRAVVSVLTRKHDSDALDASKILKVGLIQRDGNAKSLLQLKQELH